MVVLEEKEATSDEGDTRIVYSLVKPYIHRKMFVKFDPPLG